MRNKIHRKKIYLERKQKYDSKYWLLNNEDNDEDIYVKEYEYKTYDIYVKEYKYKKLEEKYKTYDNYTNNYDVTLYNNKINYAKKIETILLNSYIKKNNYLYLKNADENLLKLTKIYDEYSNKKIFAFLCDVIPLPPEIILIIMNYVKINTYESLLYTYMRISELQLCELNINNFLYSKLLDLLSLYNSDKFLFEYQQSYL